VSSPASLMTGASSGRMISTISNQSRKKPATNTTSSTTSTTSTSPVAQTQAFEELGNQLVATDKAQHIGKHGGADEDGEDEAGRERGLNAHLAQHRPTQLAVGCGQL